jgi:anti-sigma B factor antagonist
MRIEDRTEGEVLILEVKERRVDARSAPDLKEKISGFVSKGHEWIVLDISDVEFVDSSGLGAIVSGLKLLGHKGDLVISGAKDNVTALFKLTRMDKVFRLFPTTAEAQQALSSRV